MQNIFLQLVMFFSGIMTWRYEYFFQMLKSDQQARLLMIGLIKTGLASGLIITAVIYVFSAQAAEVLSLDSRANWLIIAPLSAFLVSLALACQHNAQRAGSYKVSALSEVFGKSAYVASGALLSLVSANGLIFTTLFGALGKIVSILPYSKGLIAARCDAPIVTISPFKEHAKGAHALVASHVLVTISSAAPIFFISAHYGTEILGQFSMVMATVFLPSGLIGAAIGQVFYQRAASHSDQPVILRSLWAVTVRKLVLFGAPIYLLAGFMSPWIYPFVLGGQWHDAGLYAQFLVVGAFSAFISTPLDRISLVLRKNYYLPVIHSLRLVLTGLVLLIAEHYALDFQEFLILYVLQTSFVYLLDLFIGNILIRWSVAQTFPAARS